jgi:hypothetical protein
MYCCVISKRKDGFTLRLFFIPEIQGKRRGNRTFLRKAHLTSLIVNLLQLQKYFIITQKVIRQYLKSIVICNYKQIEDYNDK